MTDELNLNGLENLIQQEKEKYFISKPSLATRQCSMATIEKNFFLSSSINRWIG